MKKKYINPTAESYNIQTRHNLLTTSIEVSSNDYDDGTLLGREGDFWEDEE